MREFVHDLVREGSAMERRLDALCLVFVLAFVGSGCSLSSQFGSHGHSKHLSCGESSGDCGCTGEGCVAGTACAEEVCTPLILGSTCKASPWQGKCGASCGEGCGESLTDFDFEYGKKNIVLDGAGWVMGIPSKILLFNRKIDSHSVSAETEQALRGYMAKNELQEVKVRVNQYAPVGEWKRLVQNKEIHAGWKYTVGAMVVTRYTLMPGRLLGGDEYNPFTNTIHLYSDRPSIALREGAHAKTIDQATYRGLYATSMYLPGSPLWVDTTATRDVLAYSRETGERALQRDVYQVLFPAYGSRLGQSLVFFGGAGQAAGLQAGFALAGHAVGRVMAASVADTPLQAIKALSGFAKKKDNEPEPIEMFEYDPLPLAVYDGEDQPDWLIN